MTDKEIEKALKICPTITSADDHCGECPYFQKHRDCIGNIEKDALDYINRLKVENEKLKETLNAIENDEINLRGNLDQLVDELKQIRKDTAKAIIEDFEKNYPTINQFDNFKWVSKLKNIFGIEVEK